MKPFYLLMALLPGVLFSLSTNSSAQPQTPRMLFRFYEDNDFLNIAGHGTDRAYTNGTRLDFFYQRKDTHRTWADRLLPTAGQGSVNVYGWSLMQIMVTPNDIAQADFQPDDYEYAGALFITRSFYSFNPERKFSLQSELIGGIRGPASFAQQTQTALHAIIDYQKPMGWSNQLNTKALVNVNVTAEKGVWAWRNILEINAGAQLRAGSMTSAIGFYPMVRFGRMAPYFDGYLSQYGSFTRGRQKIKTQYYLTFKAVNTFVAVNAMLKGTREIQRVNEATAQEQPSGISHRVLDLQPGLVIAHGNFSMAYVQTYSSTYRHRLYRHSVGTLALYFRW